MCLYFTCRKGKYYNYLNKEEMQENLGKVNANATIINYFETLPSTKRKAENIIWGNFIIKKLG